MHEEKETFFFLFLIYKIQLQLKIHAKYMSMAIFPYKDKFCKSCGLKVALSWEMKLI